MKIRARVRTGMAINSHDETQISDIGQAIALPQDQYLATARKAILLTAVILGLMSAPAIAASKAVEANGNLGNPGVMPINSNPHGHSYEEWSARFWQWEFSLPVTHHPLFDTADCSAGQSDHVWFLGGTFVTTPGPPGVTEGNAERWCTVPPGTMLFFPIVNTECSSVQGDCFTYDPAKPPSEADLRTAARNFANLINTGSLKASIDGVELKLLGQYRIQSPLFTLGPLPDNNIFQFFGLTAPAASTWHSVSDGIHLMLAPLSAGHHTLKFSGEQDFGPDSKFVENITYHLMVGH